MREKMTNTETITILSDIKETVKETIQNGLLEEPTYLPARVTCGQTVGLFIVLHVALLPSQPSVGFSTKHCCWYYFAGV